MADTEERQKNVDEERAERKRRLGEAQQNATALLQDQQDVDDFGRRNGYTKSTAELDLEARFAVEAGEEPPSGYYGSPGEARDFRVEGNDTSAYVGVSPEYRTYASETDRPLFADGGVYAEAEERHFDPANFAYQGDTPGKPNERELGQGSRGEHVLPGTSGEGVSGLRVDTEKEADEGLAEKEGTPERAEAKRVEKAQPETQAREVKTEGADAKATGENLATPPKK